MRARGPRLTEIVLLGWFFISPGFANTGPRADCKLDCCPLGSFCCGTFCAFDGSRSPSNCVGVLNGCCNNPANVCATPSPAASAPAPESVEGDTEPDPLASDSASDPPPDRVLSDSDGSGGPDGNPCKPDCCIHGTFCCGNKCRRDALASSLTCPAQSSCCDNPTNLCNDPGAGPQAAAPPTAADTPSPSPLQTETGRDLPVGTEPPPPAPSAAPAEAPTATQLCGDGCEPWWSQCGGRGYQGPGCCTEGSECELRNPNFSRCMPLNNDPLCLNGQAGVGQAGVFCQCGGANFSGEQECAPGLECVSRNAFYSQCRPACTGSSGTSLSTNRRLRMR